MDLVELSRRLENLIRIGTVTEVDHGAWRCRVKTGKIETDWLRFATLRAGQTRTWDPPTPGEQVTILSPSGVLENGIVVTGINSDLIEPPTENPDEHMIQYPDGAFVRYNHVLNEYWLDVPDGGRIVLHIGATTLTLTSEGTTLATPHFDGLPT